MKKREPKKVSVKNKKETLKEKTMEDMVATRLEDSVNLRKKINEALKQLKLDKTVLLNKKALLEEQLRHTHSLLTKNEGGTAALLFILKEDSDEEK